MVVQVPVTTDQIDGQTAETETPDLLAVLERTAPDPGPLSLLRPNADLRKRAALRIFFFTG